MSAVVDHVFICTSVGAPAADRLRRFGLTEGTPNTHPGQGTANRRFFFDNGMLELLWVANAAEARSEQTRATRLWDRWSERARAASPFGIILRPAAADTACPFVSWEYRPQTMPGLELHIAAGTELEEPMWCYVATVPSRRPQPAVHPAAFREITGVRLVCPALSEDSVTAAMVRAGTITLEPGPEHLLELHFDGIRHGSREDFRPDLPLIFRW